MPADSDQLIPTEKEAILAFNMGLQTAIYVLEKAEELSAEGRRYLIGYSFATLYLQETGAYQSWNRKLRA